MEMVVLRSFDNYISANIMLARLQDAGLPVSLQDEFTVTIDPILTNAIGGIKLIVRSDYAEKAQAFLDQIDAERLATAHCPKCGEFKIELVNKHAPTNVITALLTWLLGSYAIAPEKVYQCQHCKYESHNFPENTTPYN